MSMNSCADVINGGNDKALAALKKEEANAFYKQREYRKAVELYTEAIRLDSHCGTYLNNRAAANIQLHRFQDALNDVQTALSLEPNNTKFHLRASRCYQALGRLSDARRHLQQAQQFDPDSAQVRAQVEEVNRIEVFVSRAEQAFEAKQYNNALSQIERALELTPGSTQFKLKKAFILLKADRVGEASRLVSGVLQENSMDSEALYIRGLCMLHSGDIDQGAAHFKRALQSNPDHAPSRKMLKEEGNAAFKTGDWQTALDHYNSILACAKDMKLFVAKIYFNKAMVLWKLGNLEEAVDNCTKALECDSNYSKPLLKRAELYLQLEEFEAAIQDYQRACEDDPSNRSLREQLRHAKLELKKSKRKNYYKILGVAKDASDHEIKKAYKRAAMGCHPDRVPAEQKEQAEAKFKELGEAYGVLSDRQQKMRYDNGEDLEDIQGGGRGANVNVNDLFAQVFGGGMGGFHFQTGQF
eukprot:gene10596-2719_t